MGETNRGAWRAQLRQALSQNDGPRGNIVDVPNQGGRGLGYRYFDAVKKLPSVKELFKKPPELRNYRDDEDGMLEQLEGLAEEAMRWEAAKEWRRLDEVRREARKWVKSGEVAEVSAVARDMLREKEEVAEEERQR
ncbi:hypothetical protein V8G54_007787 [Vigna mungo]|uniref:Uncharacterized protein n=1 Tax=Vigna mungo TaxID=3915 RepID=A0AAQ3P2K2_VIGMU